MVPCGPTSPGRPGGPLTPGSPIEPDSPFFFNQTIMIQVYFLKKRAQNTYSVSIAAAPDTKASSVLLL